MELSQVSSQSSRQGHASNHRSNALESWIRLPENRKQMLQWTGVTALCNHIESRFAPLYHNRYASIWSIIDQRTVLRGPGHCWELYRVVLDAVFEAREDATLEKLLRQLGENARGLAQMRGGTTPVQLVNDPSSATYMAIFAILCWSTMTVQPQLESCEPDGLFVKDQPKMRGYFTRQIHNIFQHIHNSLPKSRWQYPIGEYTGESSITLHEASLSFKSLNKIGRIRIRWIDTICEHLDFDAKQRELSVFRFPTFCALMTQANTPPMIERLLRALYGDDGKDRNGTDLADKDSNAIIQSHQEVLLSYRLLFAQSRASRKLAEKELKKLKNSHSDTFDEFLWMLCTKKCTQDIKKLPGTFWPVACRSWTDEQPLDGYEGDLQEDSTYSAQENFPLFGQRLAKIQEFNMRQSPSGWTDLWRDRRNPLQWYTFWAVLIFGGLSLLLTFLQLLVSIAQLVLSFYQLGGSSG